MFNCTTNCLCPIRIATNGSTSLPNENFYSNNIKDNNDNNNNYDNKTELSLFFKKQKNSIYTFQKQERTFRIIRQCARYISVSHFFSLSLWLKTQSYSVRHSQRKKFLKTLRTSFILKRWNWCLASFFFRSASNVLFLRFFSFLPVPLVYFAQRLHLG